MRAGINVESHNAVFEYAQAKVYRQSDAEIADVAVVCMGIVFEFLKNE